MFYKGRNFNRIVFSIFAFFLTIPTAFAGGDLSLESAWSSIDNPLVGQTVTIYAKVKNNSSDDLTGVVQFINKTTGRQIGNDQPVSVFSGEDDGVFASFTPKYGEQNITVKLIPWGDGDDSSNNQKSISLFVDKDFDGDGLGDRRDSDDDNDGVADTEDAFPYDASEAYDIDNDGIGNNADTDDDNDGCKDEVDKFPFDKFECYDNDNDGIGNNTDDDDDNDGVKDADEIIKGSDPLKADTDGDGVNDAEDEFPTDPEKTRDTDMDGVDNQIDEDDDNDGVNDSEDAFPLDPTESKDTDRDGVGDNADTDADNDGMSDEEENMIGSDPLKADTDGDGVNDLEDEFPTDSTEWKDSDQDGLGDNADENDENKGPVLALDKPNSVQVGEVAIFDASGSHDPDGEISSVIFEFSDGKVLEGNKVQRVFDQAGSYTFDLTIKDNLGEERVWSFSIDVRSNFVWLIFPFIFVAIGVAYYFVFYQKNSSKGIKKQTISGVLSSEKKKKKRKKKKKE